MEADHRNHEVTPIILVTASRAAVEWTGAYERAEQDGEADTWPDVQLMTMAPHLRKACGATQIPKGGERLIEHLWECWQVRP